MNVKQDNGKNQAYGSLALRLEQLQEVVDLAVQIQGPKCEAVQILRDRMNEILTEIEAANGDGAQPGASGLAVAGEGMKSLPLVMVSLGATAVLALMGAKLLTLSL